MAYSPPLSTDPTLAHLQSGAWSEDNQAQPNRHARQKLFWLSERISSRENRLDQIRLLLALAVVLGHSWYIAHGPNVVVPLSSISVHGFHQYAVYLFFFVSGLLVTESARRRRNLLDFARARIARIFPALIVCAAMTPALLMMTGAWLDGTTRDAISYAARLISLASIQFEADGAFATLPFPHAINGSVWSLRHEVAAYTVLALFAVGGGLFRSRLIFAVYVSAMLSLAAAGHLLAGKTTGGVGFLLEECRYVMVAFLLGVLANRFAKWVPISWTCAASGWLVALAITPWLGDPAAIHVLILVLAYTTLCVAYRGQNPAGLEHDISYGIYIYGWPIQQLITFLAISSYGFAPDPIALFMLTLPVLIPIAMASWLLIERPCLRLEQRHQARRSVRQRRKNLVRIEPRF